MFGIWFVFSILCGNSQVIFFIYSVWTFCHYVLWCGSFLVLSTWYALLMRINVSIFGIISLIIISLLFIVLFYLFSLPCLFFLDPIQSRVRLPGLILCQWCFIPYFPFLVVCGFIFVVLFFWEIFLIIAF